MFVFLLLSDVDANFENMFLKSFSSNPMYLFGGTMSRAKTVKKMKKHNFIIK